ncbi:MAG: terminase small subunit [Planctomycetota bacterium]|jgi:hypothetical protein
MTAKLNPKQKRFCRLYGSDREFFGNGLRSYAKAYGIDISTKKGARTAASCAHKLLINADILAYINELLDEVIHKQHVDKQLGFLITQMVDFRVKLGAIKEYYRLRERIEDKSPAVTADRTLTPEEWEEIIDLEIKYRAQSEKDRKNAESAICVE